MTVALTALVTSAVALRSQSVSPAVYLTFDEGAGTVAYDSPGNGNDTTQSFTVAAWVKLNNLSGFQTFVSEDAGYQSAFFLQKRGNTDTFTFTLPFGGTNGPIPSPF